MCLQASLLTTTELYSLRILCCNADPGHLCNSLYLSEWTVPKPKLVSFDQFLLKYFISLMLSIYAVFLCEGMHPASCNDGPLASLL